MENALAGSSGKVATAFKIVTLEKELCDLWCLRPEVVEKATRPKVRQMEAFGIVRKGKIVVWARGHWSPKENH